VICRLGVPRKLNFQAICCGTFSTCF